MRIKLLPIIALLAYATCACAQQKALKQGCDFLKDVHFTNGVDTVWVLAYKNATVKPPPYDETLTKVHRDKKLNKLDFTYTVEFTPLNCSEKYIVFCKDTSSFAFDTQGTDNHKAVRMRCVVFEGYSESPTPFFVIDKIIPSE